MSSNSNGAATTLHILHTNDFHNALTDVGAARLKQAVEELRGAPYLLLDAGDAIKAGNVGVSPFGEPILTRMNDIGYHAMTMGNREFHVWKRCLTAKIGRARFPVLCGNVRPNKRRSIRPLQPHALFLAGGLRVAVFGVTVPMVTERMKVAALSSFLFSDPILVAQRIVDEIRRNADVVIGLTHIGLKEDKRLASSVPGIDLIVGGHSHDTLMAPYREVGCPPIVQAGFFAHHYGHVILNVDADGVSLVSATLCPLQERKR